MVEANLIRLCQSTIARYRAFEARCNQAGEGGAPAAELRLLQIGRANRPIPPNTAEGVRFMAAAAYALSVKDRSGQPEGKDDLASLLMTQLAESLGRPVVKGFA
jgi:hypothetical protein